MNIFLTRSSPTCRNKFEVPTMAGSDKLSVFCTCSTISVSLAFHRRQQLRILSMDSNDSFDEFADSFEEDEINGEYD